MAELSSPSIHVTFYTKAGCHLCEAARDALEEIAQTQEYELTEIDIKRDLALFEKYRYRIPVMIFNETLIVEGRITGEDLEDAFSQLFNT